MESGVVAAQEARLRTSGSSIKRFDQPLIITLDAVLGKLKLRESARVRYAAAVMMSSRNRDVEKKLWDAKLIASHIGKRDSVSSASRGSPGSARKIVSGDHRVRHRRANHRRANHRCYVRWVPSGLRQNWVHGPLRSWVRGLLRWTVV